MGCGQSNEASDPLSKKSTQNNSAVSSKPYQKVEHTLQDFLTIMIGNTATNGLVLGFTTSAFIPIPSRISIPRYCHALLRSTQAGYITGGIEDLQANVNSRATIDHQILEGTISKRFIKVNMERLIQDPQNSFDLLPDMINARYAHCAVLLNECLYVLGGRQYGTDQNGLLSACEVYQFSSKKWKSIPSMQYPRAAATAIVYGEHIYVFGGYSGNNNRTRAIQSYSSGDSSWRKLPFHLHQGFEGALAVKKPGSQCSFLIFGGRTNTSKSNRVIQINMDRSTIVHYASAVQMRSFHKGVNVDGEVVLIGGGCEKNQTYSISEQRSSLSSQPSFLQYCTMKELNSFSQFQPQINLKFVKKNEGLPHYQSRVLIFGHSFEPFAKVINTDNFVVQSEGQFMGHSFYQFTTMVKVNKEYCFVLGGINPDLTQVTNIAYSFNLLDNNIKPIDPMITPRYAFAGVVQGSYLYAIGGRKLGDDDVAIMNQCERFSFQSYKWESIASMKSRRQSATAISVGEYILVIGGYKGNGVKTNQIEMYIPKENRWVELEHRFQLSVQSMTPVTYNNQVYLFGGCAETEIQKVFRLNFDIDDGVKYEKAVKVELEPVGHLSNPGSNLKIYVNKMGLAHVFGNIPHGVDIYDLKSQKVVQVQQTPVFTKLQDPLFQAYTIIY